MACINCGKNSIPSSNETPVDSVKLLLANNVPKMQGLRTWSHIYHSAQNWDSIGNSIIYPDTSFSIEVLNDTSISFLGRILYFSSTTFLNGMGDTMDLGNFIYFTKEPMYNIFESTYYFYKEDSIEIYLKNGGMSANWNDIYRSKK